MTKQEYFDFHKQFCEDMFQISFQKNNDYSGDIDPFNNFRMVESANICTVETGLLARMTDKFARLVNLLNSDNQMVDESLKDTIMDLCNYSIILAAYLASKTQEFDSQS